MGGGVVSGIIGSYFMFLPQHSGHSDAEYRRMSDGRTSIDFAQTEQDIVHFMSIVSRALLIADVPLLEYRPARATPCSAM
jgi:hypothetical protein